MPKSFLCLRKGYSWKLFKADTLAGLSVAVIAFPLAIAYAVGANISPQAGLFTAIVAGFLISLLGGSRVQIGGPTGSMILVLSDIILNRGFESMVAAAILAGFILIFLGLTGVGTYIKYIPYPVVTALTTAIAVAIFTSQIKNFFGFSITSFPTDFWGRWQAYIQALPTWDPLSFGIGIGTLAILIYFRKFKPHFPGAVIAMAIAVFITALFQIDVATIGTTYGALPRTLNSFSFPLFSFDTAISLLPDAMTIALLIAIESLLAAVVSEGMTGWRISSNCELVAQGVATIGSVCLGGLPAAGAFARTAANVKSGAKTPVAGMMHAIFVFVILYFLGPLAGLIPLASLAAVLVMVAWNMSELHHFFHLFSAPKRDIVVLVTVFMLALFATVTIAVQVGMVLAAFLFMKQMSDISDVVAPLTTEEGVDDKASFKKKDVPEEVEIYEINGPFFFGVTDRLKNLMNELSCRPKVFILRMRKVPTIDASGMHALEEFYLECKRQKTLLLLSEVKKNPLKDLKRYHLDELIGEEHIFSHIHSALSFSKDVVASEKFKKVIY